MRKRYQESPERDAPPVSTPPTGHPTEAAPPDDAKPVEQSAIETPKPPEQPTTEKSPADQAAQTAIRQRLAEMNHAQELTRQSSQQQPQAAEPQEPLPEEIFERAIAPLPQRAQEWYRRDPTFLTDQRRAALMESAHRVAEHQVGETFTDKYFDRMEELLGFKHRPQTNGTAAQQQPARQQPVRQHSGPPVSAPISREVPSMSTGRSQDFRAPLTKDEQAIARSAGISDSEYQIQKQRMLKLKAAGAIQDG